MHLTVGEAYEALAPDDLAALAQHFAEAAPLARRRQSGALPARGRRRWRSSRWRSTRPTTLHRRALDIIDDVGLDAPELRADAANGVAVARRWMGSDYSAAIDDAWKLAAALGDGQRMARVLLDTNRGFVRRVFEVDDSARRATRTDARAAPARRQP